MATSSRWLGEWHRPDNAIHARLTRQDRPEPAYCWPMTVDGQLWLFSSSVWLLDPLGLDVGPNLDESLLAFAVERRRPLLEQMGLQHLALPGAAGPQACDWLHLDLHIDAGSSGDDTPLSLSAWVPVEALPDWVARTGLVRHQRQGDAWAAQVPVVLRWALPTFSLPAGLLRGLVAGSLIRLPFAARRDSFHRLQGCGLQIDLQPSGDPAVWVVLQGAQGTPDAPSFHESGTDMIPEDTYPPGDDADDTLDADLPQGSDGSEDETEEDADPGLPAQAGSALALDDLGIPITVLCGRVELPLQALRAWGPGSEVSLPTEALDEIELCSGQRVLARGRLIRLNDGLAVRITGVVT